MYSEYEIRTIPLSIKSNIEKVEKFLQLNNLQLDDVDYFAGVFRLEEYEILACGGLKENLIKCIAVNEELKGFGLSNRLISHLISVANSNGYSTIRVFTKPTNKDIFTSLGFNLLASSEKAILLENNSLQLNNYLNYLSKHCKQGINGCIVMNCNPFTLGHQYLIEQSAQKVDNLYIIPVKEDVSMFSYSERKMMIEEGTKHIENVIILEGSDYAISKTTFPTYFLKDINDSTDSYITLDLDIFCKLIAPALNIKYRFIGNEPKDLLTNRYNTLIHQILEQNNIKVLETKRLEKDNCVISASVVRNQVTKNSFRRLKNLVPKTIFSFLMSHLATQSLQTELDLTPKPGLVDKQDSGSHKDMDYDVMKKSINTLQPYFTKLAQLGYRKDLPFVREIQDLGLQAENAMFKTTNGINTHKGALFSIGIVIVCASHLLYVYDDVSKENLQICISMLASRWEQPEDTHGNQVLKKHKIKGALYNAIDGYKDLFQIWLPYYIKHKDEEHCLHKLLLLIMSSLDDTNIYYRKNAQTVEIVKKQARELFENFSIEKLQQLNTEYIKENISSGGAADMLSLTLFIYSLLN